MTDDSTIRDEELGETPEDCIFCKIVQGEMPVTALHSDEDLMVINDINPKAPIHLLVIPKKHIATLDDMAEEDTYLMGQMLWAAKLVADDHRIGSRGYKLIMNVGPEGGQVVPHVHLHLLGGTQLKEFGV